MKSFCHLSFCHFLLCVLCVLSRLNSSADTFVSAFPQATNPAPTDTLLGNTNVTNGQQSTRNVPIQNLPLNATNLYGSASASISNVTADVVKNGIKLTNDIVSGSLTFPGGSILNIGQSQISESTGERIDFFNADLGRTASISNGVFFGIGAGLTSIPESSITSLPTDLSQRVGTNESRSINLQSVAAQGAYQTSAGNQIPAGPVFRQTGAAYSGVYSHILAGSASAMTDLPARGHDVWDNQRKPYFILTTRQTDNSGDGFKTCKIGNITNAVNAFVTNLHVQTLTNLGVKLAFILENGWVTNYRVFPGLMGWSSNRFGTMVDAANGGICATNLTTYLRTNGFETWVMMYADAYVPNINNWPSAGYSQLFVNAQGGVIWDGSGGNPFGANEYSLAATPDSLHRDISSLYANGVSGFWMQDVTAANSSGYFEQLARIAGGASMNPYYFQPGLAGSINLDSQWQNWYGGNADIRTNVPHGMIVGMMMGAIGRPWATKFSSDLNGLITESNDSVVNPTGSRAVGWYMGQVRWESRFLTNAFGYCHFTPATDGFDGDNYNYKDWLSYFSCSAFFHANIYLIPDFTVYVFAENNASFKLLTTNANWISVWQDLTGKPPIALSLAPSNSIWSRDLSSGEKLLLLENEDANNTTNLSVNWNNLGFPSNTIAQVIDVVTNGVVGFYTNSFTWTVPTISAALFRVKNISTYDSSTNLFTPINDVPNGSLALAGIGNRRFLRQYLGHGEIGISTNDPAPIIQGSELTVTAPVNGVSLSLLDSTLAQYDVVRSGTTGNLRIHGFQTYPAVGLSLEDTTGEFARFSGQGFCIPTNPIANWATAPLTRGGIQIVNSNGYTFHQMSGPANNTWVDTNGFAIVKTSFATADLGNSTTSFQAMTVDKNAYVLNGRKYRFSFILLLTESQTAEGVKVDFNGGGATITNFRVHGELVNDTGATVTLAAATSTTLAGVINAAATTTANQHCFKFEGTIEPSASGTFIPRYAQNSHTSGTVTALRGSNLVVTECY